MSTSNSYKRVENPLNSQFQQKFSLQSNKHMKPYFHELKKDTKLTKLMTFFQQQQQLIVITSYWRHLSTCVLTPLLLTTSKILSSSHRKPKKKDATTVIMCK